MADSSAADNAPQLLNLVGQVLKASRVRWGAIGALAVAYHGWVRASMDADALITLRDSDVNMEQLLQRLRSTGWKVEYRDGGPKDLEDAAGVLEFLGLDLNQELLLSLCRGFGPEELKNCQRLLDRQTGRRD